MPPHDPHPRPRPKAGDSASVPRQEAELTAQVAQLRQVVRGRAVVDQAVGVLIVLGRTSPAQGWDVLREVSMRVGIPLREVARHLVGYARTGELPDEVRTELDRHLTEARVPDEVRGRGREGHGPARGGPARKVRPPSSAE